MIYVKSNTGKRYLNDGGKIAGEIVAEDDKYFVIEKDTGERIMVEKSTGKIVSMRPIGPTGTVGPYGKAGREELPAK